MNASMLHRSRLNLAKLPPRQQANISFIESKITRVPLPADTADVIISNCVINLVPAGEKPLVFKEMFRLLKPGGRVALNDMLARQQLPAAVRESVALYAACIAGASLRADYEAYLRDAGFVDVVIADSGADVNVYAETGSDGEKKQKKNTACCNSMPMQGHQEGGRNECRVAAGVAPGVAEKDDEPRCDGGKVESSCSNNETEQQKSCCVLGCSGKIETASLCGLNETLDGMDLNEWVGEFRPTPKHPLPSFFLYVSNDFPIIRVLQYLRSETLRVGKDLLDTYPRSLWHDRLCQQKSIIHLMPQSPADINTQIAHPLVTCTISKANRDLRMGKRRQNGKKLKKLGRQHLMSTKS